MKVLVLNLLALCCCANFVNLCKVTEPDPVVNLKKGSLRGSYLVSHEGNKFYAFKGIRYAEPPVGQLRFQTPVPVNPWSGIKNATDYGASCMQGRDGPTISEDCLFLDVYSQNLQGSLPVVVFIPGGGFVAGSSSSSGGPEYLIDHDIVFVSMNYRVGPLGFISTGNKDAPGNYAFKDQREALRWVQENIKAFGGDPKNVTLMGQSAGSMSVILQVISPSSRGLFHKAIAMSGSGVNHYETYVERYTTSLAKNLGCNIDQSTILIECLRAHTAREVTDAANGVEDSAITNLPWYYDVEDSGVEDAFLTKEPLQYMLDGDFAKIPVLTGFTRDEFYSMAWQYPNNEKSSNELNNNYNNFYPRWLMYENNPNSLEITAGLRKFYLNDEILSQENLSGLENIFSDAMISHGNHLFVKLARKFTDIYYYQNNYIGQWSKNMDENNKPKGLGHGDDLHYIFYTYGPVIEPEDPDNFMLQQMTSWWTQFAKTGSPNNPQDKWTAGVTWMPSNSDRFVALNIDKVSNVSEELYADRFAVWDQLFGYN